MIILFALASLGYSSALAETCKNGNNSDGSGVLVLGTRYDCAYLRRYDDNHTGIYTDRKRYCTMSSTDCCKTCAQILSCSDAPSRGIYIAEMYFNCSFLLQYHTEDKYIGIYKNRNSICQQSTTDCCESCQIVQSEAGRSTTAAKVTVEITTKSTTASTRRSSVRPYEDTCIDNCLWIADGTTGTCNWLLNASRHGSVYSIRHRLCKEGMAPGCKQTCHVISMGSRTTEPTVSNHSPTSTTPVCTDSYILIEKQAYACSALQNSNSNIYNNRHALCVSQPKACCATCKRVHAEKPSVVSKDNYENTIDKSGTVVLDVAVGHTVKQAIGIKPRTAARTTANNAYRTFYQILKNNDERMRKEEEIRINVINQMMTNMFTFFKKFSVARAH